MNIIENLLYIIVVLFYFSILIGFYYPINYSSCNENLYFLADDFLCECKHINI